MTDDEFLAEGRAALHDFMEQGLHDGATWTVFGNDRHLRDAFGWLVRRIDDGPSPNPEYCTHLLAASLALLARDDPRAYARLVSAIAPEGRSTSPGTADGMVLLMNLVNSVGDDHDYSLDTTDGSPVVRIQEDMPRWTPGTNPRALTEAVRPLVEAALPGAGVRP